MPRDLFGNVTDPSIKVGSRKWYTVPLSLVVHSLVLLALVVVPLLATGTLPLPNGSVVFVPVVSTPVPPPPAVRRVETISKPPVSNDAAPIDTPSTIEKEPEIDYGFENNGVDGGTGVVEGLGVITGVDTLTEPPPSPPPQKLVRAGIGVKPPEKIHHVAPVYPVIAQTVRRQGVVIIEATIGVNGRVQNARILRSEPLLDDAALDAVRQWVYTPTRLNGQPVAVVMTVTVHFQLQQ